MRIFSFSIFLIFIFLICEVICDYSDSILPLKDHRSMRLNMRVGKRFGDSLYDEDDVAPKRYLRLRFRTGKRSFAPEEPENTLTQTFLDTDPQIEDILTDEPAEVEKRELHNPKRRLRLVFRPGKRNFGEPEQTQYYIKPHPGETLEENSVKALKRRLRMQVRTGKRSDTPSDHEHTTTPQTQFYIEPKSFVELDDPLADPKRSPSHFLMNPRVGKKDRNWRVSSPNLLQKRSDPKATDLWFGPRIGRANDDEFEQWMLFNGNDGSKSSIFESPLDEQRVEEAVTNEMN